jgi:hypothetical protein
MPSRILAPALAPNIASASCMCVLWCAVLWCAVQIIHVNLTSTHPMPIVAGSQIAFTFAVNWLPTLTPFESRFERYLDYNFFEHKVGGCCAQSCCTASCLLC